MNSNYDLSLCVEREDGSLLCLLKTGKLVILKPHAIEAAKVDSKSMSKLHQLLLKKAGIGGDDVKN